METKSKLYAFAVRGTVSLNTFNCKSFLKLAEVQRLGIRLFLDL